MAMEPFEDFQVHNLFKYSLAEFKTRDPQLQRIAKLPFSYLSPLASETNFKEPGIYLLTGGRQVGKTTFLKQYMLQRLEEDHFDPSNMLFLAGELISSYHVLVRLLEAFSKPNELQYVFIDEVNYIPDWDKGIKYLADAGFLENTVVILTGSDSLILRTAMQRFAGRRGKADQVDYIFYPLSFKEFALLRNPGLNTLCDSIQSTTLITPNLLYSNMHTELMSLLQQYLIHGGYLPAIANLWQEKTILAGTLRTYIEWIIGDMLKFKKTEKHVFEILKGILSTYATQISWHSLLKHLSIDHHQTVSEYCHLLEDIHVIHIIEALNENTLTAAPKKNKKIYFQDPFIYHAVFAFVHQDRSLQCIEKTLQDPQQIAALIEGIVISLCKRYYPTFYIKGNLGEVDVALIHNHNFLPIEVKWTNQLRPQDLKQIQHYSNGIILWNRSEEHLFHKTPIIPLPKFLLKDAMMD
jgi:predicted AAA+ superfamily ATPase